MQIIELKHKFGTIADKNTNIGLISVSTSGGEITCSWRGANIDSSGQLEGSAVFRAASPLYRSENAAASGVLTIPLNRVYATFAIVTFLNNTSQVTDAKISVSIGNHDGSSGVPQEKTVHIVNGDSASFQIAFIAQ